MRFTDSRFIKSPIGLFQAHWKDVVWACISTLAVKNRTASCNVCQATSSVPIYNCPFYRSPEHSKFYRKDTVHQPGHPALRETKQGHSVHQTRTLISRIAQGVHKDKSRELTF